MICSEKRISLVIALMLNTLQPRAPLTYKKIPQPDQKRKLKEKKKKKKNMGTAFANTPSEKFAWWTRMQIPLKVQWLGLSTINIHKILNINGAWSFVRGYQRPVINGFVWLRKKSADEKKTTTKKNNNKKKKKKKQLTNNKWHSATVLEWSLLLCQNVPFQYIYSADKLPL